MSDHEQETFEKSESGARKTQNKQAGSLKKGDYVVIKGRPCKVHFSKFIQLTLYRS